MTVSIDRGLLLAASDYISEHMGFSFGEERLADLEKKITAASKELHYSKTEDFIEWLLSAPLSETQVESLAGHLIIGETYFFREKQAYEILENHILPDLIYRRRNEGRSLRIWSAGCATGEEPCSIAISVSKVLPTCNEWNMTILGTDLNPRFLRRAEKAVYSNWSLRGTDAWFKERYFQKVENGRFRLDRQIRAMVNYKYLNLVKDSFPSLSNNTNAMDVIFIRNVLMYFRQDIQKAVIEKLHHCLVPGGYLITSQTETSHTLFSDFSSVNYPDAIVYRKDTVPVNKATTAPLFRQDTSSKKPPRKAPLVLKYQPVKTAPVPSFSEQPKLSVDSAGNGHRVSGYNDAAALFERGRYLEALEIIAGYTDAHPGDPGSYILTAKIHANLGNLEQALEMCDRALDINRTDPALHYLKATIFQESGKTEEAIKELTTTLYLDRDHVLGHFTLGNLMQTAGNHKRALKHFQNTIELLSGYERDTVLEDADGLTAGRLSEIIDVITKRE
ncbi:MAG: tetratricopeptide repeat protein [Spirochaetes bacterium]|nr:tetratricopeptide repeat protein [Spirochaetota bacterium]